MDANQTAHATLQELLSRTEEDGKDPIAVYLGRRGGLKGGPARVAKMSKAELRHSARRAALARWGKNRDEEDKK